MPCSNSTSPIDVSTRGSAGSCDLKCDYRFNYPSSTCTAANRGTYLSLSYDSSSSGSVHYNGQPYNVSEIRMYSRSLHTFGGARLAGELIVVHSPVKGGKQFLVCIPMRLSSYDSNATIDKIIRAAASSAQTEGDVIAIPLQDNVFTLNTIVPSASFFSYTSVAPYSPCQDEVNILVFDQTNALSITEAMKTALLGTVSEHAYTTKKGTPFYFNKGGAKRLDGINDEIYIDCQPVGASKKTVTVDKTVPGTGGGGSGRSAQTWEFFENFMKVVVGAAIFGAVVLVFIAISKSHMMQPKSVSAGPADAGEGLVPTVVGTNGTGIAPTPKK